MSTPAKKRLMRDFKRLQQDPPAGISGAPQENNIMLWNAVIFGYLSRLPFLRFVGFFPPHIYSFDLGVCFVGLMIHRGMEVGS